MDNLDSLVRLVCTSESSQIALVVLTIAKPTKENRFLLYMTSRSEEAKPLKMWPVIEALPFHTVKGALVVEAEQKLFLNTETQAEEPEVIVVSIKDAGRKLEPIRVIYLPDFKKINCFIYFSQAKLLLVGCHETVVIFKEKGTKYETIKILVNVFQGDIEMIYLTDSLKMLTASSTEGINITDVKIKGVKENPTYISEGFKVVGGNVLRK